MRGADLAVLYTLVGIGAAIAVVVFHKTVKANVLDVALVLAFWPLYGPILLMRGQGSSSTDSLSQSRLQGLPPQEDLERALSARVDRVQDRISDIDDVLARPKFDEAAALERHAQLEARGDDRAAASAWARIVNIRRLRGIRDRFETELAEVRELMEQLEVQSQVVRFAGHNDASGEALRDAITHRIEGLDAMLDLDAM